jgi:cytoskeletal protein CcmA (bactofilin family)
MRAVSNLLFQTAITMAIFSKDRDVRDRDAILPSSVSTEGVTRREATMFDREKNANQTGGGAADAFLGKGTKVTGTLVFEGTGRIEGRVEGEISAQDVLTIGEGATVSAKITGTLVVIEGHVTGDVIARQRLELRATGRVHGNVSTPSLVVHEGAILDGQCKMGGIDSKPARDVPGTTATKVLDRARESAIEVAATLSR